MAKQTTRQYKYIGFFPTPFLEDLVKGKCLPFIGAGFSKNAVTAKDVKMPAWDELGKSILSYLPGYSYSGALDAISAYSHEYSRVKLVEKLNELLLTGLISPGAAHKAFCSIPFQLVCTTNFDFLLEKGYDFANAYCKPIVEEDQLSSINSTEFSNSKEVALLKIHGDLHHPSKMVLTEEDYDSFLNRQPLWATYLGNLMISKTLLFIGYSLDDPDMRQVWQIVKDRLGSLRKYAYTIRVNSDPQETARFERRGIKVINIISPNKNMGDVFSEVFGELRQFWLDELPKYSTGTEEESLTQFTITKDRGDSKIVYFSVPIDLISAYKKYVFPIITSYGFVPMTVNDIITNSGNSLSKIYAIIDRSAIIVIDASNKYMVDELVMTLSKVTEKERVIAFYSDPDLIMPVLDLRTVRLYKKDDFYDVDKVISIMQEQMPIFAQSISSEKKPEDEHRRLLEKHEYSAALISAYAKLEVILRAKYEPAAQKSPVSVIKLMINLYKEQIVTEEEYGRLREGYQYRNALLHEFRVAKNLDKRRAEYYIENIELVIDKIGQQLFAE
jgi:hypothetical protein